jgi:hypothetical protein
MSVDLTTIKPNVFAVVCEAWDRKKALILQGFLLIWVWDSSDTALIGVRGNALHGSS